MKFVTFIVQALVGSTIAIPSSVNVAEHYANLAVRDEQSQGGLSGLDTLVGTVEGLVEVVEELLADLPEGATLDSIIDELLPYLNQINTTAAGIDDTTAQVTSGDNILGGLGGLSGLDGILATVTSLVPNITSLLGSINAGGLLSGDAGGLVSSTFSNLLGSFGGILSLGKLGGLLGGGSWGQ